MPQLFFKKISAVVALEITSLAPNISKLSLVISLAIIIFIHNI